MTTNVSNHYTMNFDKGNIVIKGHKINDQKYSIIISNPNVKFSEDQWKDAGARAALLEQVNAFVNKGLEVSRQNEFLQGSLDKIRFVFERSDALNKLSTKLILNDKKTGDFSYEMGVYEGIDEKMGTLDQMLRGESFSAQSFAKKGEAPAQPAVTPTPAPTPSLEARTEPVIPVAQPVTQPAQSAAPANSSLWGRAKDAVWRSQARSEEERLRRALESQFPQHKSGINNLFAKAKS